ncbi:hypothetical protein VCUG_01445 [Vavraia culicis subsp. floridensis]|uniref:N-acetyltransferase domain-containing protein n=1 Tax=Vavraia culicis (isolate floridensis) TaxID=948595 RepID=L2GTY4_VAVCU|nr:uncharacterized protein VCUG_01445 [Vavraia culicis subsp. floridensis]ELA47084.1 hypothetical protein VCUG_01445 [Vavraia culicis subsp. floridensis]
MYKTVPFLPEDIFSLDLVNLDSTTDNYSLSYYLYYHLNFSDNMCLVKTQDLCSPYFLYTSRVVGYIIGKQEKKGVLSMHVSSLSIAPTHRKCGLATSLMHILEAQGNERNAYFVDLFVRCSNFKAIAFYERNGYVKYRRVLGYYTSPEEDAYDMRISLERDGDKRYMVPLKKPVRAEYLKYE